MKIAIGQLNQQELIAFVQQYSTGSSFSGAFVNYVENSGFMGGGVIWTTGGFQTVTGVKEFLVSPVVPFSGADPLSAASQSFVVTKISDSILEFSGYLPLAYVDTFSAQNIGGAKTFSSPVNVALATNTGHAINLAYLQVVSGQIVTMGGGNAGEVVYRSGDQSITGVKTFVSSPIVPTPTDPFGAVPKNYVDSLTLTGVVYTTGDQTIAGTKTFSSSPLIPVATVSTAAVQLAQLEAAVFNSLGYSGGAAVTSFNGVTGSIFSQGAGTVTTFMCGNVLTVSGNTAGLSQMYSAQIPLPSGVTGITYVFGTGFSAKPTISDGLQVTGGSLGFMRMVQYNVTSSGFGVAFESGIPTANYVYNFNAVPASGGSGFLGLQGAQGLIGPNWNPRGPWQVGKTYSPYDYVFLNDNSASYIAYSGNISDVFNKPVGTGNGFWSIVSSGRQGDIGATGAIGYLINSGVITGSFTSVSFFLSPGSQTGLNLAETFAGYSFNLTGFKLGCYTSGSKPQNGGILTGSLYLRDDNNVKMTIRNFTFDTGRFTYFSGGLGFPVTGGNRIGIDITNSISGIDGLSIGVFGF